LETNGGLNAESTKSPVGLSNRSSWRIVTSISRIN